MTEEKHESGSESGSVPAWAYTYGLEGEDLQRALDWCHWQIARRDARKAALRKERGR